MVKQLEFRIISFLDKHVERQFLSLGIREGTKIKILKRGFFRLSPVIVESDQNFFSVRKEDMDKIKLSIIE